MKNITKLPDEGRSLISSFDNLKIKPGAKELLDIITVTIFNYINLVLDDMTEKRRLKTTRFLKYDESSFLKALQGLATNL